MKMDSSGRSINIYCFHGRKITGEYGGMWIVYRP